MNCKSFHLILEIKQLFKVILDLKKNFINKNLKISFLMNIYKGFSIKIKDKTKKVKKAGKKSLLSKIKLRFY